MEADQIKRAQALAKEQSKADGGRKRSNAVVGFSNPLGLKKDPPNERGAVKKGEKPNPSFKERVSITMKDTLKQGRITFVNFCFNICCSKKRYKNRTSA